MIIVAVVTLYVGAGIFVPLVLSVLLAFALAPLVNRLRHLHVPHVVAVIFSVALAGLVLATIGYVVSTQLVRLAADLPSYQTTVATKLKGLQSALGGEHFFDRLGAAISQLKSQVSSAQTDTLASRPAGPVPVTIANTPENPLGVVQSILGSVLGPMATAAIVTVFLVFLLLERADLRDRFLKLVSRGDLRTSTKVMDEAAARVGRYLLVQFGVNLVYGVIFGIGLTLIGVPNGILWGLLATLFRYIPFVGTLIVASIPFTLAFAVDPGWSMLLKSVALFIALELVTTNVVEPRLYGSSTGLSPLAVLVAAMFWATLWGPVGLILSTPLTVCLVVLGRYVPQLQFFETLLGSQPVLQPEERLYQRLVAGNTEEAIDLAEDFNETADPVAFYEQVAIPALRLAEMDLSLDPADLAQRRRVVESLEELLEEIEQDVEPVEANADVLVIGGRTELDGVAARIVGSTLRRNGVRARELPPIAVRREALGQLEIKGVESVCLVYLGGRARSYARFVARRLKRERPDLRVLLCVLNGPQVPENATKVPNVDATVASLGEAVQVLKEWQQPETVPASDQPEQEDRQAYLQSLRMMADTDPRVGELLKSIAERLGAAVATAEILSTEAKATTERAAGARLSSPGHLTDRVAETGAIVVVADASTDKDFMDDAFLLESGVRFYAGAPLRDREGEVIGVLALMDESARDFSDEDRELLLEFAAELRELLLARVMSNADQV